jgi:hypothetical protein
MEWLSEEMRKMLKRQDKTVFCSAYNTALQIIASNGTVSGKDLVQSKNRPKGRLE